jgi:ABC-2 type transport system ATP-binding protein
MRGLLLQLASMGKTLIVTSHILPELARICDTVAIITHGKLRAFGTQADIMRQITQRRIFEVQLVDHGQLETAQAHVGTALASDGEAKVSGSETEGLVRFDSSLSDRELAGILAGLLDKGVSVSQFREIPTDLEDAFLSVTSRRGDGSAAETPAAKAGMREPA